jgi:hypothetical protein
MGTHDDRPASPGTLAKGQAILLASLGGLVFFIGLAFLAAGAPEEVGANGEVLSEGPNYAGLLLIGLGLLLLNGGLTVWAVVAGVRIAREDGHG